MPEELKQHIKEKQSLRPNEVESNLIYSYQYQYWVDPAFFQSIYYYNNNCFFWYSSSRPTLFGCLARERILPMLRTLGHAIIILAWDSPIIISHSKTLRATYRQSLLFSLPLKVSIHNIIPNSYPMITPTKEQQGIPREKCLNTKKK